MDSTLSEEFGVCDGKNAIHRRIVHIVSAIGQCSVYIDSTSLEEYRVCELEASILLLKICYTKMILY